MGTVFISYRRGDSEGQARALYNELEEILGRDAVFMDVDSIDLGRDFRDVLRERLRSCDQMLALIGPRWLDAADAAGNRRLDQANDFVRQEIAAALKRSVPVTPILLQGAQMPASDRLPEDLKDLAFRNGFELSHSRWESDLGELVRRLGLRRADALRHAPGAGAPAAGADAAAATWPAAGPSPVEAGREATRDGGGLRRAQDAPLSRWLGWMVKLVLIVLLAGFVLGMIAGIVEELSPGEKSSEPGAPATGSLAPAEPRMGSLTARGGIDVEHHPRSGRAGDMHAVRWRDPSSSAASPTPAS
jgi:hypothetical protein